MYSLTMRS